MADVFQRALSEGAELLTKCLADPTFLDALRKAATYVTRSLENGNRVFACGNGGSLADAAHFAEEFSGRFRKDRAPLPAMAFTDPMHMSCVANDYGYEFVFSRMVEAFGNPGDVLLLLSTSGNSPNLVRAAESARDRGVNVVGFLGRGGGDVAPMCDVVVLAPGETSDRIQEIHMLCLHALIESVESSLGF